jgi:hypothetical protein
VQLRSFLTWLHTQKLALKVIERICQEYSSGVEILEHYSDYYRVKLEKQSSSIGRLFGLIERSKEDGLISEYSVS